MMYRYVAVRKKVLGVDKLHMYDVYTPIVAAQNQTYEFEQAEEKKLTWSALLKSPTFWVSAVICLGSACLMLTQVTVS